MIPTNKTLGRVYPKTHPFSVTSSKLIDFSTIFAAKQHCKVQVASYIVRCIASTQKSDYNNIFGREHSI